MKIMNYCKNKSVWNMCKTLSKMHMHDTCMKLNTIVFEIVCGRVG